MECLFFLGFIIFAIVKSAIEANKYAKKDDKLDFSSFESLPSAPESFLKKISSEGVSGNNSSAFSGGFNEESSFNDPSISFLPQTQQPQRSSRRVNLKRQAPKNSRQQLPPAPPPAPKPASANLTQRQILKQLLANSEASRSNINFTKNDILKAFIMQELLQKHDLNKIFERVPDINRDK